ncbi:response regulator [Phascolarctobacterium faecium]|uniref:response regulator n=1 Tax=Phascolarctobacterium faecium TaxID=33025 RepID=UPI003FEF28D0
MISAGQKVNKLMQDFFTAYFNERDYKAAADFLREDISWIGLGAVCNARDRSEAVKFLQAEIAALPYAVFFEYENVQSMMLSETAAVFLCDLLLKKNKDGDDSDISIRVMAACNCCDSVWKIAALHVSQANMGPETGDFFPAALRMEKVAEVESSINRQMLGLLNRSIPGGILGGYVAPGFPLYYVNERMLAYLGYTYEEFVTDTKGLVMNGIHPDDLERVEQIASRAMEQDSEYEVKYRMKKKDGSYIWVSDIGKKVLAVNGKAACISVIRDISGEIEAKQKLYEESVESWQQKNILQNIIDTMPSGLLQCSFDRIPKALMVNRTGANILGFENEHEFFLQRDVCDNILRCIHPEDRTKVLEELFSIAEAGIVKNSSHRIKTAAGEERWVRSAACVIQNQQGEKIYQIIFHDVTEILQLRRKNKQWDLMERSALYTAITSAYPMIIFGNLTRNTCSVLDQEGQRLHSLDCGSYDAMVNGVLNSVAPEYRDEFVGKFARQNQLAEYERGANETYMEHHQLLDDGQYHWVSAHKIKVENPVNDDILTVSLIRCIDEQKDNEAEKNQILRTALGAAEAANNAKTEFLSRMSHEIRTPMNAIIGMTAIALSALDNKERISDCLAKIGISARFLLSLINDILDMSRIESGRMNLAHEKFDFEEMINGLSSLFYPQAEEKGLKFNTVIEGVTEELYIGDSLRLRQILLNILSNALKFTPSGGRIQFTIRQMSRGDKDAWLRFTVSDTGIGMSKVFQKHLFESFEQENPNISIKYGGTGLGLAICKNLVTLMGGSINVHSIEGVGSEFCVDVKLGLTEESYRRKNFDILKLRDLKTLIVDDDIVTCEHASLIMSDLGLQAEYVTSGASAVLEIEKGIREMKPYDIVLVDLKMPDMDGIQTAKAIRRLVGAETLVVVMTAYEWKEIEADARRAGVDFFITKPLFRSELVDLFEKINDFSEAVYEPETAKGEIQFAGERILLVEDNELNLEVAASLLEMKGLTIESACNGLQALEKFCSTPVGYYDAVLMDIRMPVMDGLEAARNIRLFDKSDAQTIPIIAMTANAFDEDVEKSHAAGMNAHLAKPIDPEKLFAVLQEFI